MAGIEERNIGERIKFRKVGKDLQVVIGQKIPRWQEALLVSWLAAWTFCGVFFIYALAVETDENLKLFIIVTISFWAYFFFRILKVVVWRIDGAEELSISKGEMHLRNRFWKFGKKKTFIVSNIRKFNVVPYNQRVFLQFLEHSFWTIGGDRMQIEYGGNVIRFGKQLQDKEALALGQVIDKSLRENQK